MDNNPELELAWNFIEKTGTHVFLTGKAGTGKTSFLRRLKKESPKRMVIVAPTGIAAINARGVTIHSFFQLPFAPFIPDTTYTSAQTPFKFSKEKINIIRSLDLLVIDEISMVRADQLDAMDDVMRRYRDRDKPFGGVQLLMIGDMQQLAPVVKESEWALLSSHYDTSFFFGSRALRQTSYITIELKTVYRQSDIEFINILNNIRENKADDEVLAKLNQRCIPGFIPKDGEGYIRLTTHNHHAHNYNEKRLNELDGEAFTFEAYIEGNFPETSYPADQLLTVKPGAQIMFIKNDSSPEKRFYNGKIGIITGVDSGGIRVLGEGDIFDFVLETEEWKNSKYTLAPETKEITEQVEGTFTQYPIRLAWAITIHKSQGLTFEKAIIDANTSFAHGQVYVALSRCKSLEGMVLVSPLNRESIISDYTIDQFTKEVEANTLDDKTLYRSQLIYFYEMLSEQFDFQQLEQQLGTLTRLLEEHFQKLYPQLVRVYKRTLEAYKTKIIQVAEAFKNQYTTMLRTTASYEDDLILHERIISGAAYFHTELKKLLADLIDETQVDSDNQENNKRFAEALKQFDQSFYLKLKTLELTEKDGFTVISYLRNKAQIILEHEEETDKNERKNAVPEKLTVSRDILHPVLYKELSEWRNKEARKNNLPTYTVLQQKAILGMTNLLPQTNEELLCIPYIGQQKIDKYGHELLSIIQKYCSQLQQHEDAIPPISITEKLQEKKKKKAKQAKELKPPKKDTREITFNLFREGLSIDEIAAKRELVTGTIALHLEKYVEDGSIPVTELVTEKNVIKVTQYVHDNGTDQGLAVMKAALGEDVSYSDIKLVIASLRSS